MFNLKDEVRVISGNYTGAKGVIEGRTVKDNEIIKVVVRLLDGKKIIYRFNDKDVKVSDYLIRADDVRGLEYRQGIINRLDRQTEKGIEKYGTVLSDYDKMKAIDRLEHLAEELTDGLVYIEHIIQGLKD